MENNKVGHFFFTECICPDGYEDVIDDSINCFKLGATHFKQFDEARQICKDDGAQLPSDLSLETSKILGNFTFNKFGLTYGDDNMYFWLPMKMESGIGQSFITYVVANSKLIKQALINGWMDE